jgi:hypothetical protein
MMQNVTPNVLASYILREILLVSSPAFASELQRINVVRDVTRPGVAVYLSPGLTLFGG